MNHEAATDDDPHVLSPQSTSPVLLDKLDRATIESALLAVADEHIEDDDELEEYYEALARWVITGHKATYE